MPEPIQLAIPKPHIAPPEDTATPRSESTIAPLPLVEVSVPLSDLAVDCADKILGLAVAATSVRGNPAGAALGAIKAVWEISNCFAEETHQASVQETIIECTNQGGTPVGVLEDSVSCQGMKP